MEIGCIEGVTRFLGVPKDWDKSKGHCGTLPVRDMQTDFGNCMVSAWLLSRDEISALTQGAPLYLHIFGVSHPVVGLSVGVPPADGSTIIEPVKDAVVRVAGEKGAALTESQATAIALAAVIAAFQSVKVGE